MADKRRKRGEGRNKRGSAKIIPLSEEAVGILKAERARFVNLFGREPGDSDPVFLDMNVMTTNETLQEEIAKRLETDGLPPAEVYAYRKTGLWITKENRANITKAEMREWEHAKTEYERLGETAYDDHDDPGADEFLGTLVPEYLNCLTVMAFALSHGRTQNVTKESHALLDYVCFCFTKSLKSMRAIGVLTEDFFGEDGLIIARSIYENYLHAVFLLKNPAFVEDLFAARVGLILGTHEYKKNNSGKPNYSVIIDKSTGKELNGRVTTKFMAKRSPYPEDVEIQQQLYDFLSSYTHPDVMAMESYVIDGQFDHRQSAMFVEAYSLGFIFGTLLLDCAASYEMFDKQMTADVRNYLGRIRPFLLQIHIAHQERSSIGDLFETLSRRLARVNTIPKKDGDSTGE